MFDPVCWTAGLNACESLAFVINAARGCSTGIPRVGVDADACSAEVTLGDDHPFSYIDFRLVTFLW